MDGATAKRRLIWIRDRAFFAAAMLFPFWLAGQIARDSSWFTGLCFYIPSAFLVAAYLSFCLIFATGKQRHKALLAFIISLPPLVFVGFVENRFLQSSSPPASANALRLVHWNVGGRLGRPGVVQALVDHQADLYVFSEIGAEKRIQALTETLGQPYQSAVFGNLAVVGKGRVRPNGWILDRDGVRAQSVVWEYAGQSLTVLVVDLPSSVFVARAPILKEIMNIIEREQPDLVVGDFNAPRRSIALSNLPAGYQHAYDTVGTGAGYTWPTPVPMYSLDQCIFSPRITPIEYDLVWSLKSDHCRQVFDFSLP